MTADALDLHTAFFPHGASGNRVEFFERKILDPLSPEPHAGCASNDGNNPGHLGSTNVPPIYPPLHSPALKHGLDSSVSDGSAPKRFKSCSELTPAYPGNVEFQPLHSRNVESDRNGGVGFGFPTALHGNSNRADGNVLSAVEHSLQSSDNVTTDDSEDEAIADVSDAGSTVSISSDVLDYRRYHGRTYHAVFRNSTCQYPFPNDEKQNNALCLRHKAWFHLLSEKSHLAPTADVKKVLDVGTGTGIWAEDYADHNPNTEVIGIDLSPIQPIWVPPNLKFEIDDCNLSSSFRPDSFDFIHVRDMAGCIANCIEFARKQFDMLKGGGWFEWKEASPFLGSDDSSHKVCEDLYKLGMFWQEVGTRMRQSWTIVTDNAMETAMHEAKFTKVERKEYKMPIGSWSEEAGLKKAGAHALAALSCDLDGHIEWAATKILGWSAKEARDFVSKVRNDLKSIEDGKARRWWLVTVVYGQKPKLGGQEQE